MITHEHPYLGAFLLKDESVDSDVILDVNSVHPVGNLLQVHENVSIQQQG
jgi:Lon-like ATP-dependent protease